MNTHVFFGFLAGASGLSAFFTLVATLVGTVDGFQRRTIVRLAVATVALVVVTATFAGLAAA